MANAVTTALVNLLKGNEINPRVPSINEPLADVGSLAQVCKALRQGLQSLSGARGPTTDRAVTFRDLIDGTAQAAAGGGSAFDLTVKDSDDTTVVTAVNTIAFAPGLDVTDAGSRTALVSASGSRAYRIALYVPGTPSVGYVMLRFTATDVITFPAGAAGSHATADFPATGTAVYTLEAARGANAPNTFTTVGTITFTASDIGAITLAATLVLAIGDIMRVICTASDSAIRDISVTFHGTRS